MIRPATAADIPEIHRMIRELAAYERGLHEVTATEDDLRAALLADRPALFAHVAVEPGGTGPAAPGTATPRPGNADSADPDSGSALAGTVVGFAVWFLNYSTWAGTHGIYLEDLYVAPEARGRGHGKALLAELARICVQRGYRRLEWSVLDWNSPARGFYGSLGAVAMDEWTVHRLTGDALAALAGGEDQAAPPAVRP